MAWIRTNVTRTEIVIVAVAAVVFVVAVHFNTFEGFYAFTRAHENWQIDEIANLGAIATVALGMILWLRSRRLAREVKRRVRAEARASALARHDALTGIANRRLFREELNRTLAAAKRSGGTVAVFSMDLNRFKRVNDSHGHDVGDRLLVAVTERLKPLVRAEEVLARLGGDEFALAIANVQKEDLARLANRIAAALEQPFELGGLRLDIGVSIGIALYPDDAHSADKLLQHADLAMYRAKAGERGGHAFFDPAIDQALRDRTVLEADLRRDAGTDAIVPFYQPLIDLDTGRIVGFEMLARWNHPTRGTLLPEVFIPIAEDARIVGELSLALLRKAVVDARQWDEHLFLSVNIAPDQFKDPMLAAKILGVLEVAGFPPERLEIELTETALVHDIASARQIIADLKRAGVRIAIDDFGKGYSSLYYLRELPFDVVKIDRSFVGTRRDNAENAKIVTAVIGLSEALGIASVAEGIEEQVDADWLRSQGCRTGQGFLYSEPVPAAKIADLLEKTKAA